MRLRRPETVEEAVAALGDGALALAGGTELVPLMRDGLVQVDELVSIQGLLPRGIHASGSEPQSPVRIGAGTVLSELEVDPQVPAALREACRLAASPQLRSMGTLGGNLRQATRCWYWRLGFPCRLHGGDRCHAREGEHREHAVFANGFCASAHPSDLAAALLALGATVRTDRRELPLAHLYRVPTEEERDVVALAPDELVLELDVPRPPASTYLKAMDRARWAFPLVGVAAARTEAGVRLALAGVAPIPWLLDDEAALETATPLPGTAYKVELARALVRRAIAAVT